MKLVQILNNMTKRQIKQAYKKGKMGLTDAMSALVFDFSMDFTPPQDYLEK